MTVFLTTVLSFPTLIYSVLLAFCVVYWLLAATGIVEFDTIDGWLGSDGHSVEPSTIAGMLARLGLSGVPIMLVLTLVSLFGWLITYFAHLRLLSLVPGPLRWVAGVIVLLVALLPGVLATSVLLRPVAKLIVRLRPPEAASILGRAGNVISPRVDESSGRAQFDDGGAGLILQVRALPSQSFERGQRVVLIEHLPSSNAYRVISETTFHQQ